MAEEKEKEEVVISIPSPSLPCKGEEEKGVEYITSTVRRCNNKNCIWWDQDTLIRSQVGGIIHCVLF